MHSFPGADDPASQQRLYFHAVAAAADYVVEHHAGRVLVLPQTLEDLRAGRLVQAQINHQDALLVLEDDLAPSQLQELYAGCSLVLGTRMHANILAMCVNTPVVAIGYQPKTAGIMSDLRLGEWVVPIEELDDLLRIVRDAWLAADELRQVLPAKIAALRSEATARAADLRAMLDARDA
jgi:colanic acid/amylovoran biosynthesis protein